MYKVGLIGAGRISERHIEAMKTINQFKLCCNFGY